MKRRRPTNRIQTALDRLGIDWHSPRYGRPRMPAKPHVIVVPDGGSLGTLVGPMRADGRMHLDPRQPPAIIRADAEGPVPFWRNAPRFNLGRVARLIERELGRGVEDTIGATTTTIWRDQAGTITLTCWPGRDRFGDQGEDRLSRACAIEIVPGWRRPLSEDDVRILDTMKVVGRGTPRGVRVLNTMAPTDEDIGYVREPGHEPSTLDAVVGVHKESRVLVACPGRLMIMPLERISHLRHDAFAEGVSAGHATLTAALDDGREIVVAEHDETHGLELVSISLARMMDVVVERIDAVAS